jgi:plasmid stabilization system protein ParE
MVKQAAFKLVWDRKALDHLKDILSYLSKKSEQAPQIVKAAILERLEIIRKSPLTCEADKLRDYPNKDFRAFVVFSYRITYQINSKKREIRILRVRHTSREPLNY